jgi:hypothetical protein
MNPSVFITYNWKIALVDLYSNLGEDLCLLKPNNKKKGNQREVEKKKKLTRNRTKKGICCIGLYILIADHKYKVQLLHIPRLSYIYRITRLL